MNDLQIEYFIAVARNMSFTGAARELFVSQPAISRQVLSLEEELGCTLFDRTNKNVRLTESGEIFFRFFTDYKSELNNIKLHAQLFSENRQRTIRLGLVSHWDISPVLLPAMKSFGALHPSVEVQFLCYDINDLNGALSSDAVDLAMTIDPVLAQQKGLSYALLGQIPRVLLYARGQWGEKAVMPADFREEMFLVVAGEGQSFYTQDLVRGFCRPYGFVPKIHAVNSTDAMMTGILCHSGVAIVDAWNRELHHPSFAWTALDSSHDVTLIWKAKWEDPVILDFVQCLKNVMNTNN